MHLSVTGACQPLQTEELRISLEFTRVLSLRRPRVLDQQTLLHVGCPILGRMTFQTSYKFLQSDD